MYSSNPTTIGSFFRLPLSFALHGTAEERQYELWRLLCTQMKSKALLRHFSWVHSHEVYYFAEWVTVQARRGQNTDRLN